MSKKDSYKELVKSIEASDVILEVLDARDPIGMRCIDMERMVLRVSPEKHLVLLINKIGLLFQRSDLYIQLQFHLIFLHFLKYASLFCYINITVKTMLQKKGGKGHVTKCKKTIRTQKVLGNDEIFKTVLNWRIKV